MKYAVIKYQGHQYKVVEGEEILVDKLLAESEPQVLLVVDDGKVKIGKPSLKETKVKIKVLAAEEKGEKLDIFKFKAKSRYRRKTGFRPVYTRLLIEKIIT
ncbi:50S ribosomal protein L21 [Candidatus Woesebacteria bacterium]|nr:50S ribosomal protein L21 [Candidatus Woesebacteria bacterium]